MGGTMAHRGTSRLHITRRRLLTGASAFGGTVLGARLPAGFAAPGVVVSDRERPQIPCGVMSGDPTGGRAIIWSRTDRPARMLVEYATREDFRDAQRVAGPAALAVSDYTARVDLGQLSPGAQIFYRVTFQDLADPKTSSAPAVGSLRMAGEGKRTITFAYSGDEAGQGWGINPEWGGYRLYETMRRHSPDFFIHSGDQIYADNPIVAEVKTDDGKVWKNLTTEGKSKVAETLDEYRAAFAYNLLDENKRRFAAETAFLVQWDDHETRNNWYPGQIIGVDAYKVKSASLLSAYARQAMFEYNPMRFDGEDAERVYRRIAYGPALDVLMLDERSYRGPNSPNRQPALNETSAFLGAAQLAWLKRSLLESKATWKLIASDMPISLVVPDLNPDVPKGTFEAWANADNGPPSGRELEIASLLSFIKNNTIKNVVWVTADVHYAHAIRYAPERAQFTDFDPFWEFVAGPINAGTFGPNDMDMTFGPETKFVGVPSDLKQNRSPFDGFQFYGIGRIDGDTNVLTMSLHDVEGKGLYAVDLEPEI
jgi:alkaline phosphatase D